MEEAAGFVSCGFFFVTFLSPLALRPGMRPVLQNIGRSGIGNMLRKGYACDRSPGFREIGNGCRPCTQVGSRPLQPMFCGIPNQRQSKSFSRWLNGKTLSIAGCSARGWAEVAYGRCDRTGLSVHSGVALAVAGVVS